MSKPEQNQSLDPKGGARWAAAIIFGGIFMIAATGLAVVIISHCNREQPYLDQTKIRFNPNNVRPIPPPIRPKGLGK